MTEAVMQYETIKHSTNITQRQKLVELVFALENKNTIESVKTAQTILLLLIKTK